MDLTQFHVMIGGILLCLISFVAGAVSERQRHQKLLTHAYKETRRLRSELGIMQQMIDNLTRQKEVYEKLAGNLSQFFKEGAV